MSDQMLGHAKKKTQKGAKIKAFWLPKEIRESWDRQIEEELRDTKLDYGAPENMVQSFEVLSFVVNVELFFFRNICVRTVKNNVFHTKESRNPECYIFVAFSLNNLPGHFYYNSVKESRNRESYIFVVFSLNSFSRIFLLQFRGIFLINML